MRDARDTPSLVRLRSGIHLQLQLLVLPTIIAILLALLFLKG